MTVAVDKNGLLGTLPVEVKGKPLSGLCDSKVKEEEDFGATSR